MQKLQFFSDEPQICLLHSSGIVHSGKCSRIISRATSSVINAERSLGANCNMTDTSGWLAENGLEKYATAFEEAEIELTDLQFLDDDDLKELMKQLIHNHWHL